MEKEVYSSICEIILPPFQIIKPVCLIRASRYSCQFYRKFKEHMNTTIRMLSAKSIMWKIL